MNSRRIILAGGSGFLGNALAKYFCGRGDEVVVLTRSPRQRTDRVTEVAWDGRSLGDWAQQVDGADAVINLTGKNINCPFTPENRRLIVESRVAAARIMAAAVQRAARPPGVLIQASAIGFYGDTGGHAADESTPGGTGFLAEACRAWESAQDPQALVQTRCVTLRIGVVLGPGGGALPMLARLTRWFLGGAVGDGRQYLSWIHLEDFIQIAVAAVDRADWRGVFNCTAPQPVTNAEFMRPLRQALRRPWSPPAPAPLVRMLAPLLGTDASLALGSQRVVPARLLAAGFQFRFRELFPALKNLLT